MLAPWKKSYDQPDGILKGSISKSRDITLLTKVHTVKALVFPVVKYEYESWTIKKAERQRIDAFELWCWKRLLRVSWTARRSNQSIQKEISPEYLLEGLMLKLKLQYLPPDMWSQLTGKDPDAGKSWRQNRRARQRMRWSDSITNSRDMDFCKLQKIVEVRGAWHTSAHEAAKSRT